MAPNERADFEVHVDTDIDDLEDRLKTLALESRRGRRGTP